MNRPCHLCGAHALDIAPGYGQLRRVTSDCKPWPAGGQLASCRACGCDQAVIDETWRADADAIYAGYSIYHQSAGAEQAVFDRATGEATHRSARLVRHLLATGSVPECGRLGDVGCGNGAFLRAFSEKKPGWSLVGSEVNDRNRAAVEAIPRVESLHVGRIEDVDGPFDVIVMIHVLEHVASPTDLLGTLRTKLGTGASLIIEVPDRTQNPFEILIADHATHFSAATLQGLMERSGFEVTRVATDWVPKEISLVARRRDSGADAASATEAVAGLEGCAKNLRWLQATIERGVEVARTAATESFGLFGSSIAATWLATELEGQVSFFVDEDPARGGATHLGLPIYHPREVPHGAHVLLVLPDQIASSVGERLRGAHTHFTLYGPLEERTNTPSDAPRKL